MRSPHLYRLESWPVTSSQPAHETPVPISVRIIRSEPGREVQIELYPVERRAVRSVIVTDDNRRAETNVPRRMWSQLQELREQDVRELGRTEIDGVTASGFQAPFRAFAPEARGTDGTIRVWVNEETAEPMRIELRTRRNQQYFTHVIRGIEWNVPLADTLFEIPDEEGWQVEERVIRQEVYPEPGARFKPGVEVRVISAAGEVILTEADVAGVTMSSATKGDEPRVTLHCRVTEDGERRLVEFSTAHVGETVTIMLDGEVMARPRINAPLSGGFQIIIPRTDVGLDELIETALDK
jgi:preprotein translocase subunit SecD